MASNGYPQQGESAPPQNTSAGPTSGNTQTPDHVGWCFVKQYYTVLSESPDKLNVSSELSLRCKRSTKWLIIGSFFITKAPRWFGEQKARSRIWYKADMFVNIR